MDLSDIKYKNTQDCPFMELNLTKDKMEIFMKAFEPYLEKSVKKVIDEFWARSVNTEHYKLLAELYIPGKEESNG